jgi:hypothetical protein
MKTVTNMTKLISKPLPAALTSLALTATLLAAVGCTPKTPAPTTASPAASTTSAVPGQSPVTIKPDANQASESHPWTDQQILTCTVSQCWQLANKSEDTFFDIVQQLAATSAQDRGLTLPQNEAAGQKVGEMIKAKAKADHEQLLYAIVDDAVRQVGTPAPAK